MFNFFKSKQIPSTIITAPVIKSLWRNNMWVMSPRGVGVLFELNTPCVVHLVNDDGTTKETWQFPVEQLRQAMWSEIPEIRRKVTKEKALELGYA